MGGVSVVGQIRTRGSQPPLAPITPWAFLMPWLPLAPIAALPSPPWWRVLPLIPPVPAPPSHPQFLFWVIPGIIWLCILLLAAIRGGSSSLSPGPLGGARGCLSSLVYSIPSALCHQGSKSSVGDESDWAESTLDDILLSPILLPADKFTLSPIKLGEDYLKSRDLILYWLWSPGFSTAHDDSLLVTDIRNSLTSQFWEGQLRTALKDGSVRHLLENTDSKYFEKGFEMLQVLEDNFRSSSISNSFTTLLALFNDTQDNKESIHEFCSWFEATWGLCPGCWWLCLQSSR